MKFSVSSLSLVSSVAPQLSRYANGMGALGFSVLNAEAAFAQVQMQSPADPALSSAPSTARIINLAPSPAPVPSSVPPPPTSVSPSMGGNPTTSSINSFQSDDTQLNSVPQITNSLPTSYESNLNDPTSSILSASQVKSSSSSAQTPSYSSQPTIPTNSLDSPSSSQAYPSILSITEVLYGTLYPINVNGMEVGTFSLTGGAGLFDAAQPNTLSIYLDTGVDLGNGPISLFTFASSQGEFQSIEIVGESCQSFERNIVQDGSKKVFEVIFSDSTCAPAARPTATFFPTTSLPVNKRS